MNDEDGGNGGEKADVPQLSDEEQAKLHYGQIVQGVSGYVNETVKSLLVVNPAHLEMTLAEFERADRQLMLANPVAYDRVAMTLTRTIKTLRMFIEFRRQIVEIVQTPPVIVTPRGPGGKPPKMPS